MNHTEKQDNSTNNFDEEKFEQIFDDMLKQKPKETKQSNDTTQSDTSNDGTTTKKQEKKNEIQEAPSQFPTFQSKKRNEKNFTDAKKKTPEIFLNNLLRKLCAFVKIVTKNSNITPGP